MISSCNAEPLTGICRRFAHDDKCDLSQPVNEILLSEDNQGCL